MKRVLAFGLSEKEVIPKNNKNNNGIREVCGGVDLDLDLWIFLQFGGFLALK